VTATVAVLAPTADSTDGATAAADDAQPKGEQQVIASILQPTPSVAPSATSTLAPTPVPPTSTPTTAVTTYKIRAGDTPLAIAGRFDIGVNELLAANGLTAADARRLRVGQELLIPILGEATQPVATSTPTATTIAATSSGTATAAPAATATPPSALRLDAPQLRSPESGAALSCGGENSLIWLPVSFMREGDRYLLHLGFLSGYNTDGSESVTWMLEQLQPVNATIWRMDEGLCGLSPQDFGRQWRWYVEVVEPAGAVWQPVSLPSTIWAFSWN
jgi:LysM repeat protein